MQELERFDVVPGYEFELFAGCHNGTEWGGGLEVGAVTVPGDTKRRWAAYVMARGSNGENLNSAVYELDDDEYNDLVAAVGMNDGSGSRYGSHIAADRAQRWAVENMPLDDETLFAIGEA